MKFRLVERMDEQVTKVTSDDGPAWMPTGTHTFSVLELTNHMLV